jgi:thioredoxin-related protein
LICERYSRGCRPCDAALTELETIDDEAEKFNVEFVKINDKRLAKTYGIVNFPTLTFFRDGQIQIFEGKPFYLLKKYSFLKIKGFFV